MAVFIGIDGRFMRGALLAAVLLAGIPAAADDEVKLKNGDRLTGKVAGMAGGKLAVETPHSGKVVVDFAQVLSLKTEGKVAVKLVSGETVEGKLDYADGKLKIQGEGGAAPTEATPAAIKAFNEPPVDWHGNVNVAFRAAVGNTDTVSGILSGELVRASESDEILARAIFRYAEAAGTTSERNAYALAKYSYRFVAGLYGFASVEFLTDQFRDLQLQFIASLGGGYDIVKESWVDLSAEAGVAFFNNDFRALQPDENHFGARLSLKFRIDLPLNFVFKDLFTIYPNFETTPDFQIRNEATLSNALGAGWNLVAGVITEFDNRPSPGTLATDNTYFAGLGFSF